ncbi:MAG TPA: hypothetical protein VFO33_09715 [Casimicrobiaceae bacterium]|nr:hypothetical protein [Casimicrobiaceae bacterium]
MAYDYTIADPIATTGEFKAALLATRDWMGISPTQLQMLQTQCRAQDCTITATQIKEQLGLKSVAAARLAYSTFARAVADQLGYAPPSSGKSPVRWWFALSIGRSEPDAQDSGEFEWIMRPELAAALRSMKWA